MLDTLPFLLHDAGPYPLTAWTRDWRARDDGVTPRPCPKCARVGFYGPRIRPSSRYRACRFCGFWQDVGEEPEYRLPTIHGCLHWPVIAGAPYVWWIPMQNGSYSCPFCLDNQVSRDAAPARNPFLVERHPWRKVPQNRGGAWYVKFWSRWRLSRGRAFL